MAAPANSRLEKRIFAHFSCAISVQPRAMDRERPPDAQIPPSVLSAPPDTVHRYPHRADRDRPASLEGADPFVGSGAVDYRAVIAFWSPLLTDALPLMILAGTPARVVGPRLAERLSLIDESFASQPDTISVRRPEPPASLTTTAWSAPPTEWLFCGTRTTPRRPGLFVGHPSPHGFIDSPPFKVSPSTRPVIGVTHLIVQERRGVVWADHLAQQIAMPAVRR
jgi:hypothetical protein